MTKGKLSTDNNNINSTDKYGYTALMEAALSGNIQTAAALIQKGADINLVSEKISYSPLIFASSVYKTDMILFLIKYGGNVNQKIVNEGRDNHDQTALQLVSDQLNKKTENGITLSSNQINSRKILAFYTSLATEITTLITDKNLSYKMLTEFLDFKLEESKSLILQDDKKSEITKTFYLPDKISLINLFCINEQENSLINALVRKNQRKMVENFAKNQLVRFDIAKNFIACGSIKLKSGSEKVLGKINVELTGIAAENIADFLEEKDMVNLLLSTSVRSEKKSEKKLDSVQPDDLLLAEDQAQNFSEPLKPKTSIKNPVISKPELTDKKDRCVII